MSTQLSATSNHLIEITNDLFDIASRLKSINENYKVYYNAQTDKFEVHDTSRPHGNTLAFVVPYAELDARTLTFALFTRVENAKKIFNEVEDHNRKIQQELAYNATQNALQQLQEGNYANA